MGEVVELKVVGNVEFVVYVFFVLVGFLKMIEMMVDVYFVVFDYVFFFLNSDKGLCYFFCFFGFVFYVFLFYICFLIFVFVELNFSLYVFVVVLNLYFL